MTRKLVFVSYAHADEPEHPAEGEVRWLTFVLGYLNAAFKGADVEIFFDRNLAIGTGWGEEIERRLRICDAFVLLVSPQSMTSAYVVEKEIPIIRGREEAGVSPLFAPIILTPTPEAALTLVRDKNWRPRGDRTLWDYPRNERARKMMEAGEEIAREVKRFERQAPQISDPAALAAWLKERPSEVGVAIAVRAALRLLPLYSSTRRDVEPDLIVALFRAAALQWFAAKYSTYLDEFYDFSRAASRAVSAAASVADASASAASASAELAASAFHAAVAGTAASELHAATASADAAAASADVTGWRTVAADIARILAEGDAGAVRGAAAAAAAPLWPESRPPVIMECWNAMRHRLPADDGWSVWFDWYEQRLQGGAREKAYELVFASVPEEVWEQGAKAANAWIAARLPNSAAPPRDLPPAHEGVESPVAYDWNAVAKLIRLVIPARNLPHFLLDTGPDDHAESLAACRAAAERLLRALQANKHNVRADYAEDVKDYLDTLPTSAEKGAILPAYNLVLSLRDQLIDDWENAPARFRNELKRLIDSNFALFRFYDVIERHNIAIASSKQVDTLPKAPVRAFVDAVAKSPGVFSRDVVDGLRGVEALGPDTDSPQPSRGPDAPPPSLVPAPPLTPTAAQSADRQKAGAINALWKVFLEGPNTVGATDAWTDFAQRGDEAVKPILQWLERSMGD